MSVLDRLLDPSEKDQVLGEIYMITNAVNNKKYVGQTVTHRLNKGKYRPFGSLGRFKDHISEATNNTKKKQCWYLNNAINLHKHENFSVELLKRCPITQLDEMEQHYIKEYNTLYPNGYNLTLGGKTFKDNMVPTVHIELAGKKKRGGCSNRTTETREKIKSRLVDYFSSENNCKVRSNRVIEQHDRKRMEKFKSCVIDPTMLDKYIQECSVGYEVKIGTQCTQFSSKTQSKEELYNRAMQFLKNLSQDGNAAKLRELPKEPTTNT